MKKNIEWIVFVVSLSFFVFISVMVVKFKTLNIDYDIYNFISRYITNYNTFLSKFFSFIGSAVSVITITAFSFIFIKNKKISLFLAYDLIMITIIQYILKYTFLRKRPIGINIINETGYSFPSGHSLTAVAFFGLLIYFIYKSNLKFKKIFIFILFLLIFFIGLSRIYLGVHYFSDVVGGFSFSICYLILFIKFFEKYGKFDKIEKN